MPLPGERIRVTALIDTAIVSGPGRQLAALVEPLRDAGVDLQMLLFERVGDPPSHYRRFLDQASIEHVVVRTRGGFDQSLLRECVAALESSRPDIVETHSYRPTVLTWLARRRAVRWRWLGFHHGTTYENLRVRAYQWVDRLLLPAADHIVVMSREQEALFARHAPRVSCLHNAVLPASRDGAFLDPATVARVEALSRPRLAVLGRLSPEKGVDVMLHALALLVSAGTPASLVIGGDGPERTRLGRLAERLGVADRVAFIGYVLPVEPLYALVDVLVIPSRSEGLPNVLLEALRADIRIVAARVGAIDEILRDGAGRIVMPDAPAALAQAIESALAEPHDASRPARAEAVRRLSLESRVASHVALYRALLTARTD
jgi:glycosyltransferase involved in cell wall biosynthesis